MPGLNDDDLVSYVSRYRSKVAAMNDESHRSGVSRAEWLLRLLAVSIAATIGGAFYLIPRPGDLDHKVFEALDSPGARSLIRRLVQEELAKPPFDARPAELTEEQRGRAMDDRFKRMLEHELKARGIPKPQ
jgi:hypothetical protein